ncbi:response regulator aspartate phosphatase [Geomicrobium sp. JCM 19037]|uniref:response regulator aspartate phosphatase n=1 Tax=Geomicrobium sp. JCM 19037 TaxID=1460634 RepID=UPI00045F429D|nr:RapH N-terminal domain-containing protein [Geomicrobium sp. JCM 19037]GAK02142.1 response regulator aspartate phosphatase [Geomicrobium sp. JCM 19037]
MPEAYAPQEVGGKINKWYQAVSSYQLNKSIKWKATISPLLKQMEQDHKVITFYQLVSYKHEMLVKQFQEKNPYYSFAIAEHSELDYFLKFLSEFMMADFYYYKEQFEDAFDRYRNAERMLMYVEDKIERAEFKFRLGKSYDALGMHRFAKRAFQHAVASFEQEKAYLRKTIESKLCLADSHVHVDEHEEASKVLKEVLIDAEKLPHTKPIVRRSIALYWIRIQNYAKAKPHLELALVDDHYRQSAAGANTEAMLAKVCYMVDDHIVAKERLLGAEARADELGCSETKAVCSIIRGLYEPASEPLIDDGINALKDVSHTNVYVDALKMLVNHYEKKQAHERALFYMRKVLEVRG